MLMEDPKPSEKSKEIHDTESQKVTLQYRNLSKNLKGLFSHSSGEGTARRNWENSNPNLKSYRK